MKIRPGVITALTSLVLGWASSASARSAPGLVDGRLAECPASPNCICTDHAADTKHFSEPVELRIDGNTLALVERTASAMGGRLEAKEDNYLAFSFRTRVFRFVDDFEIRLDPANNLLHIRSASRLGRSDFGVNRRRVDRFKEALGAQND